MQSDIRSAKPRAPEKTDRPARILRISYRREFGEHFSEAGRKLWMILIRENEEIEWMREKLRLGKGMVNMYLYGKGLPNIETARKFWRVFRISPWDWVTKPKRRFDLEALRRKNAARVASEKAAA